MTNVTILNNTNGLDMYYEVGHGWLRIPADPIQVSSYITIMSYNSSSTVYKPFAIGFDMNNSSSNVQVTASVITYSFDDETHYDWRLSNITGDDLHITIKNQLDIGPD